MNKTNGFRQSILYVILLTIIFTSCSPAWNRNNTKLGFIRQVEDRIGICDKPVYLTPQETQELINSLSGQVKDMFMDDELDEKVMAYNQIMSKGVNKNEFVFVKFAKDKKRYVELIYTRTGNLFAAGGGKTRGGGLSGIWFESFECQ